MEREPQRKARAGRLLGASAILGVGAGAVAWLSPGGLGEAGAVKVTEGASASAYQSVTEAVADAPSWLGPLLEVATEGTLVVLGMLLVRMWWIRSDRSRHRRGLCGERGGEARRGRGAPLSCVTRGGRPCRGVPRGGRLVVSEQPRNPGRRIGGRSGRAVAPSRRDHAAVGRGRRAAARAGGSPLPARCARRRAPRRHRGGGPAARVHALCPMGGITAGKTAEERSRPHGPRPRQRPGCPRPASPGWNSRGL